LVTLRRIVFAILLLLFMLLAAVFAYSNPEPISIDIGVIRLEQVSMSIAFAIAFAFGWVFGLVSAGLALLRTAGEKRRLRKELKYAEAELSSLRAPSLQDAN
jgi:uncharacterized membrane protein YciS (DUF1049 family)